MKDRASVFLVFTSLVMTMVILVVYSVFLFQRDVALATRLAILEQAQRDDKRNIQLDNEAQNKRLDRLESEMPSDLKVSHDEILVRLRTLENTRWRRNLDQRFQSRLSALEQWRLKVEQK